MAFTLQHVFIVLFQLFTVYLLVIAHDEFANPWLILKQVELSHPNAELRLLEVFYHKIYKVLTGFG